MIGNDLSGGLLVFMLVLLPLLLLERWIPILKQHEILAGATAAAVAVAVVIRMRRLPFLSRARTTLAQDLANGEVEVQLLDVVDAIKVGEFEDEGSNYYLKLNDGQVMFLSGQYLNEPEASGTFPATRIAMAFAPLSRQLLEFRCEGTPFAPSATLPPFDVARLKAGSTPGDGELLAVDFEALKHHEAFYDAPAVKPSDGD